MTEDVFKIVELVGTSDESISKAIKGAVASCVGIADDASGSVR